MEESSNIVDIFNEQSKYYEIFNQYYGKTDNKSILDLLKCSVSKDIYESIETDIRLLLSGKLLELINSENIGNQLIHQEDNKQTTDLIKNGLSENIRENIEKITGSNTLHYFLYLFSIDDKYPTRKSKIRIIYKGNYLDTEYYTAQIDCELTNKPINLNKYMIYTGEWLDGQPDGKGKLIVNKMNNTGNIYWEKGEYEGIWKKGKIISGKCKYKDIFNKQYDGEFIIINAIIMNNGIGKELYSDGQFKDGLWKDNKFIKGLGKEIYSDGQFKDGLWEDGKFNKGFVKKIMWGETYEGNIDKGKKNGFGVLDYAPGEKEKQYSGNWFNDKRQGKGTMTYSDGTSYNGIWFNNIKHGKGILTEPDGLKYDVEYANDKIVNKVLRRNIIFVESNI